MRHSVYKLKRAVWDLFGALCDHRMKTLNFHLLDYLFDNMERFGTIHIRIASMYEHYNFVVKQAYGSNYEQLQSRISETVSKLNSTLKKQRASDVSRVQQTSASALSRHGLMQHGECV